eukprot:1147280-Pelagomonas_calceolata.AAC.21
MPPTLTIDTSRSKLNALAIQDSGIQMQEDGDVTVPLISLGLSCVHDAAQEYKHVQVPQQLLGNPRGPASAQHVDILGNEEMLYVAHVAGKQYWPYP